MFADSWKCTLWQPKRGLRSLFCLCLYLGIWRRSAARPGMFRNSFQSQHYFGGNSMWSPCLVQYRVSVLPALLSLSLDIARQVLPAWLLWSRVSARCIAFPGSHFWAPGSVLPPLEQCWQSAVPQTSHSQCARERARHLFRPPNLLFLFLFFSDTHIPPSCPRLKPGGHSSSLFAGPMGFRSSQCRLLSGCLVCPPLLHPSRL